jgi:hypothetical protein
MNTPPRTTNNNNMPPPTLRNIRSREIQPDNIPFPDMESLDMESPDMESPPVGTPTVGIPHVSNSEIQGIDYDLSNYLNSNNNNDDKIKRIIKSNYNKATKRYLLENYTDNTYNPSDAELDGYNIVGGKRQFRSKNFKKTKSRIKKTKSKKRNFKRRKSKKSKKTK